MIKSLLSFILSFTMLMNVFPLASIKNWFNKNTAIIIPTIYQNTTTEILGYSYGADKVYIPLETATKIAGMSVISQTDNGIILSRGMLTLIIPYNNKNSRLIIDTNKKTLSDELCVQIIDSVCKNKKSIDYTKYYEPKNKSSTYDVKIETDSWNDIIPSTTKEGTVRTLQEIDLQKSERIPIFEKDNSKYISLHEFFNITGVTYNVITREKYEEKFNNLYGEDFYSKYMNLKYNGKYENYLVCNINSEVDKLYCEYLNDVNDIYHYHIEDYHSEFDVNKANTIKMLGSYDGITGSIMWLFDLNHNLDDLIISTITENCGDIDSKESNVLENAISINKLNSGIISTVDNGEEVVDFVEFSKSTKKKLELGGDALTFLGVVLDALQYQANYEKLDKINGVPYYCLKVLNDSDYLNDLVVKDRNNRRLLGTHINDSKYNIKDLHNLKNSIFTVYNMAERPTASLVFNASMSGAKIGIDMLLTEACPPAAAIEAVISLSSSVINVCWYTEELQKINGEYNYSILKYMAKKQWEYDFEENFLLKDFDNAYYIILTMMKADLCAFKSRKDTTKYNELTILYNRILNERENQFYNVSNSDEVIKEFEIFRENTDFETIDTDAAYELEINCYLNENSVDWGKCGDTAFWQYTKDNELIISGKGEMYNYATLDKVDGTTPPWAKDAYCINKIIIQDGITSIGAGAFADVNRAYNVTYDIKEFSIPSTINIIGNSAFAQNPNINVVLEEVSNSFVNKIEDYAFCCTYAEVEYFKFPKTIRYIGKDAFACTHIKSVYIPGKIRFDDLNNSKILLSNAENPEGVFAGSVLVEMVKIKLNGLKSATIYGYNETGAEEYATEYNIPFVSLNNTKYNPKPNNTDESNNSNSGTKNYNWYLEPTIETDEMYVFDIAENNLSTDAEYDENFDAFKHYKYLSVIKKDNYYNVLDYNGKKYLEDNKYDDVQFDCYLIEFFVPNARYTDDVLCINTKSNYDNETLVYANTIEISYNNCSNDHGLPIVEIPTLLENGSCNKASKI